MTDAGECPAGDVRAAGIDDVDAKLAAVRTASQHRFPAPDIDTMLAEIVTDVEVFQEILHRYAAIGRREAIQPAFDALRGVVRRRPAY